MVVKIIAESSHISRGFKENIMDAQITFWGHVQVVNMSSIEWITILMLLALVSHICVNELGTRWNKVNTIFSNRYISLLTHWGRVTHIGVGKLTTIGSNNGLSPDRRQAIISTNGGIWLIGPLGTNFREIVIEILTFSFKKIWKCRLRNGSYFVSVSMCYRMHLEMFLQNVCHCVQVSMCTMITSHDYALNQPYYVINSLDRLGSAC